MPRRLLIALGTVALLVTGVLAGAAPAQAASSTSYRLYLEGRIIDGYSKATIIRGSGASGDTLKVWVKYRYWGANTTPRAAVTLERKVGSGAWTTIKRATRSSKYYYSAKLPKYTVPAGVASQTVKYRFTSAKSASRGITNTDHSKTFTVKYENQALYTGFAATMYSYLQSYCRTVAVHIDSGLSETGYAGEYQIMRGITINPEVESYSAAYQEGIALHECAHYHQFANFGKSATGLQRSDRLAAKIFVNDVNPDTGQPDSPVVGTFDPVEHAADCASHAVQPAGYLGYGGYCNAQELAAGYALLVENEKY
ncbi:MAG: hypothetical protein QM635_07990 [Microbacteriaceae bacterium]